MLREVKEAIIYTDGSSGNGGDGGWAAIVATPYFGVEIWGYDQATTNNRMEMTAAIEGMKLLEKTGEKYQIKLVSDSAYMLNSIQHQWYLNWFKEAQSGKYIRPNLDLWYKIAWFVGYHEVTPIKVKGHSGHEHNERVDKLAVAARKEKLRSMASLYGNPIG